MAVRREASKLRYQKGGINQVAQSEFKGCSSPVSRSSFPSNYLLFSPFFFCLGLFLIHSFAKNSAEDIKIYVRGKVESLISGGDLVLEDLSLQVIVIQEPISKADGM